MILEQIYLGCLSQASYLIGDEASKTAVVVDPRRDVDVYLEKAEAAGLKIEHVFLTHFHADFLAGHLELRERTGATIHLGARAKADYPHTAHSDGDVLELSPEGVRLKILETPGHTPEGISILVFESAAASDPHAVLTGDTLFIGDVGRPDLMASIGVTAEELGGMLYDSLHEKLMKLPDETLLYPGHGAGSACGKSLSSETVCTIGKQRKFNYALQPMTKEAFVEIVAAGQPPAPAYFLYDAMLNRQERPTLESALECVQPLTLEQVVRHGNQGAQLLDVRSPREFSQGHLRGSINVGLGGRFAGWAGAVLDPKQHVIIIAPEGDEQEACMRLGRIGFDNVVGYLQGGSASLADLGDDLLGTVRRFDPAELRALLAGDSPPRILDVRGPGEREEGYIEGSLSVPLPELPQRMEEVPREGPLVVHCRGGYRSMVAASLMARAGYQVSDLLGGIVAWEASTAKA